MKRSILVLSVALLALPVAAQAQYLSQAPSSYPVGPPGPQDFYNQSRMQDLEWRQQQAEERLDQLQKQRDEDEHWRSYDNQR